MSGHDVCGLGVLLEQISATPGVARMHALQGDDRLTTEVASAILEEAERFSSERLAPFASGADSSGCTIVNGRVALAPGHKVLWDAFRAAGWIAIDVPASHGGQGLSAEVALIVQEIFDRGSVAFGMASGASRSASRVLLDHARHDIADLWVPKLATGDWAATICISEPGAGSDVGRIRTKARASGDRWIITGEKIWTSFGDHDLTSRIGHLVLARPEGASEGVRGLSLFLVPNRTDADTDNHVVARRLEEKLGLHASPTCAMGFEGSEGQLIGAEGRGVAQLFSMIVPMRLQAGTQGTGIASASYAVAAQYAEERVQGGHFASPPTPIANHADIQIVLGTMAARIATMRGLVLSAGVADQLASLESDTDAQIQAQRLRGWLLPIVKNGGAELAFEAASEAILVLGGAGYTRDWPIERHLRDSRVLAIYEGTTGMQALDLVRRQWIPEEGGYEVFLSRLNHEISRSDQGIKTGLEDLQTMFCEATAWLREPSRSLREVESAARSALALATQVAIGWIAARTIRKTSSSCLQAVSPLALSLARRRARDALFGMHESLQCADVYAGLRRSQ